MSTISEQHSLQVKRLIKAPRERVFAAWMNPDILKQWFGPDTCQVQTAAIDLRVGGEYRFEVSSDHGEMSVRGVYREIAPPAKLVFTWQWEDDPEWAEVESLVTVDFIDANGATEVRITHEGLPSEEHRTRHEYGWNGCLIKLAARADAGNALRAPGQFSWNELLVDDVAKATAFYTKLFGWEATAFGGGEVPYTLFKKNGNDVAGMMKKPMPGTPSQWLPYITVESADNETKRIAELGGTICAPPFDVPNVGRIAVALDPEGVSFGIFQPFCGSAKSAS